MGLRRSFQCLLKMIVIFFGRYKMQLIPTTMPSTSFHSWHVSTCVSVLSGNSGWLPKSLNTATALFEFEHMA